MPGPLKRGEVYRLKGVPRDAANKPRPILIVSRNELNGGEAVLAVPFFSQQLEKRSQYKSCVRFFPGDGMEKDCVAKADGLTLFDKALIDIASGPMCVLDDRAMAKVEEALRWTLGMDD